MKTTIKLTLLGVMALATVAPAFAQDALKASIPFAFNVGTKALPSGEYVVQPLQTTSIVLRNAVTGDGAIALAMTGSPSNASARPALVFHQYGDRYFLAEVSTPDNPKLISMSKLERQVAARAKESAENRAETREVVIAARGN
jgi:hypothetical protein